MKINKKAFIFIFIILLPVIFVARSRQKVNTSQIPNAQVTKQYQEWATLKLNQKDYDISSFIGKTALEALEKNSSIEKKGEGVNAFITGINGVKADDKKREFWEMTVNGKQAEVGAGSYIIKDRDTIEWKLKNY